MMVRMQIGHRELALCRRIPHLIVGGLATKRILRLPWGDGRIYAAALVIEAFVLTCGAFASGTTRKVTESTLTTLRPASPFGP